MKPVCWWCCYSFEWESLHFPYAFTSNTFQTMGHFCSWSCMKAYAIDRGKLDSCELITLMRKRMEGKIKPINKAPNRYCLEMFGGMTQIEDFRNEVPVRVHIPGEAYQIVKEEKIQLQQQSSTSTDTLKLKRDKPLERTKGKLETSLGIIRKCHAADKDRDRDKKST